MWKTNHWGPHPESLRRHLCPHCDSLGPHHAVSDALPSDLWLECIDCGAMLGQLTPQGVEPVGSTWPPEAMAPERPGRIEGDAAWRARAEEAAVRHPQSASEALQIIAQVGLLLQRVRR